MNFELMQSNLTAEQEAKLREAFGEEAEAYSANASWRGTAFSQFTKPCLAATIEQTNPGLLRTDLA